MHVFGGIWYLVMTPDADSVERGDVFEDLDVLRTCIRTFRGRPCPCLQIAYREVSVQCGWLIVLRQRLFSLAKNSALDLSQLCSFALVQGVGRPP